MKSTFNYVNPADMQKILNSVNNINLRKWDPVQIQMLFKICYWLGLRMIEARKLKVEDFDFDRREVYLGKTKAKENDSRKIPLIFIPELELYLRGKTGQILKEIPHRKTVEMWARKIGLELDLAAWTTPQKETHEKTKGHIFRKSLGKDMLAGTPGITPQGRKAGLPIVSLQLGHSNLLTTTRYLKAAGAAVDEFWDLEEL